MTLSDPRDPLTRYKLLPTADETLLEGGMK